MIAEMPSRRIECEADMQLGSDDYGNDHSLTIPMGLDPPALPTIDGPKMKPFAIGNVKVLFQGNIGEQGVHSNVFRVVIGSNAYALKLFKTWSVDFAPEPDKWAKESAPDDETRRQYFNPFNNECRAYGRIEEKQVTRRYWQCHGYLKIPSNMREQLYKATNYNHTRWQVRMSERVPTSQEELRWPIFGLVKDLGSFATPKIDPELRSVRLMLGDIKTLHRIGILNDDIASRNYIGGRIVDFSSSITMPHICSGTRKRRDLGPYKVRELVGLDEAVKEFAIKTKVVAFPNSRNCRHKTRAARRVRQARNVSVTPLWQLGVNVPQDSDDDI